MKNFLRALRYSWPYRGRLIVSIACAVAAAGVWSVTFTAVWPIQKILTSGKTLQQVVEEEIKDTQNKIDPEEKEVAKLNRFREEIEKEPENNLHKNTLIRRNAEALQNVETRLASLRTDLYRWQVGKKLVTNLLPEDRFDTLALIIGLVVAAVAIKGFFDFWQETLVGSVVNLTLLDLRNRFYRNAIRLDVSSFNEDGTHDLMARLTNDTETLGSGIKTLFGKVIAEPLKAIGCVVVACWISWKLTLMFLVLVPIAFLILTKVGRIMKRATRHVLERMSNIYKILQETFLGIRVVKAFTMEPYERRRFCAATRQYYTKAMWVVKLDALSGPIIEVLGVAAVAGALLAGAYLVLNRETTFLGIEMTERPLKAETLMQLYTLLLAIADPVRKLSSVYTRMQSGGAAADRIFAYMDREPRVQRNSAGPRLQRHSASIEFRDVCFSYEPSRPILTGIHLLVRHGETVALVGKNGSGKSSLVGLLPRFYDPDHGSIYVDGVDIRTANLRSLRQQIGFVTQHTVLFDDSVFNNIAYGSRRASREKVEEAARHAFAHDFILQLSRGYDTPIGEAGTKLSGGQRQRLALARAILRDPSILILDEFTSQYDAESEVLIHRALREFIRGRTTFVITHRLNTLEIASRIIVVDNGRILAVGTHNELLADCPAYQRLHEAQFQRLVA
jgi:ATP-binding cassette subfamily B protein/subfamily B ATP-binding cassette protein MsbA